MSFKMTCAFPALWKLDSGGKRLSEFPVVEQGVMAKLVEASSVIAGILRDPLFFGYSDQPYEVSCDGCTNSPVWNLNKTMNF